MDCVLGTRRDGIKYREEAFARHGENAVAAVGEKLVDEDPAAGACGHGRRSSASELSGHYGASESKRVGCPADANVSDLQVRIE